jgi:hypothetical protein
MSKVSAIQQQATTTNITLSQSLRELASGQLPGRDQQTVANYHITNTTSYWQQKHILGHIKVEFAELSRRQIDPVARNGLPRQEAVSH